MINKAKDTAANTTDSSVRFQTPDQLRKYLDDLGQAEVDLKAYPISGEPEVFRYYQHEQVATSVTDGRTFDSMEDFFCYVFQCDAEGYPRIEYVDIVISS
jgi:hypothetical protein